MKGKPAWYELGLSKDGQAIQIGVHRLALQVLRNEPWGTAPLVTDALKEGLTFTEPYEGNCGFNDSFKLIASNHPDWIVWEFALPKIHTDEYNAIYALRLTIYAFLSVGLRDIVSDTGWPENQLINVLAFETVSNRRGSGGLGARLHETVIDWVAKKSNHVHFLGIAKAMERAYFSIAENLGRHGRFHVSFDNSWFTMIVSGDASYINGEVFDDECEIGPHNVDSVVQQISLLYGLAALHDSIRKRSW